MDGYGVRAERVRTRGNSGNTVVITTGGIRLRVDGERRVWRSRAPLDAADVRRFEDHLATLRWLDRFGQLATVVDGGIDSAGHGWYAVANGTETVADWLIARAGVSLHTAGFVAESLAPAIAAMHAAGLVADITPHRLLLDEHGAVLLVPPPPEWTGQSDPPYTAPERLEGADATPASDAYSVAALIYTLLAGKPPYGTGVHAILRALVEEPPELRRHDVPTQVLELLSRGMARQPEQRPGAPELARSLAAALTRPAASGAAASGQGGAAPLDSNPPAPGRAGSEVETLPPTAGTPGRPVPVGDAGSRPLGSGYLLDEVIGAGATGRVWRGRRRADGAPVAVKVLREEFSLEPDAVVRFLRERTTLREIAHPHVVRVHDLVAEGDTMAVVMDLVDGEDLRKLVRRRGLTEQQALAVLSQASAALAAVHAAGVVHRDIKPENVLVTWVDGEPNARLTDFGLAWVSSGPQLTRSSQLVGTPAYVAPELVAGRRAGTPSDVYALGVTAYELLTGDRPFAAPSTAALLQAHLDAEPARPPGMPDQTWQLLGRCLAKDPADRPTAAELATSFDALWRGQPLPAATTVSGWASPDESALMSLPSTTSRPAGEVQPTTGATRPEPAAPVESPKRRRRRPLIIAVALCVVVGTGIGIWLGRPDGDAQSPPTSPPPSPDYQVYDLQVVASSHAPGIVKLTFPNMDEQPGFVSYVIYRDTTLVRQVGPKQGIPPVTLPWIDTKTEHCYRVQALLETDRPPPAAAPKAPCIVADGKTG